MNKSLTNADIITIIKTLKDKDSFLNNISIKLPYRIMWPLKVNMKALTQLFDLIAETEKEIYQECMKPEYLEDTKDENRNNVQRLKQEYQEQLIQEVNSKLQLLSVQTNDLDIQTFPEDILQSFMQKYDEQISLPEFSALEYFISPDTNMKSTTHTTESNGKQEK